MADNTQLPGDARQPPGGDVISTEDLGTGVKMPRSKIALGDHGVDGGDVTGSNPMPTTNATIEELASELVSIAHSLLAVSRNIDASLAKIAGTMPANDEASGLEG